MFDCRFKKCVLCATLKLENPGTHTLIRIKDIDKWSLFVRVSLGRHYTYRLHFTNVGDEKPHTVHISKRYVGSPTLNGPSSRIRRLSGRTHCGPSGIFTNRDNSHCLNKGSSSQADEQLVTLSIVDRYKRIFWIQSTLALELDVSLDVALDVDWHKRTGTLIPHQTLFSQVS